MRAIFSSKFPDLVLIRQMANLSTAFITNGSNLYTSFIDVMIGLKEIDDDQYISIPDLYDKLGIKPFLPMSKRMTYKAYNDGVIVGAGSGEDCVDLIGNANWHLFDLTDQRMINKAVGYCDSHGLFNMCSSDDGDSIVSISEKHRQGTREIEFVKIDSLGLDCCSFISIDAEGAGLDVIAGAIGTIKKFSPDLMVSIYHNSIEFLQIIPLLYDMGYSIDVGMTTNPMPQQPHLDLVLFCEKDKK